MKHLKLFNENDNYFLSFFNQKIDWKFFRMLQDSVIKYEDDGLEVYISILIEDPLSHLYYTLYYYSDEKEEYFSKESEDQADLKIKYEDTSTLYYGILIMNPNNGTPIDWDTLYEIESKIKNKCSDFRHDDVEGLICVPKPIK